MPSVLEGEKEDEDDSDEELDELRETDVNQVPAVTYKSFVFIFTESFSMKKHIMAITLSF